MGDTSGSGSAGTGSGGTGSGSSGGSGSGGSGSGSQTSSGLAALPVGGIIGANGAANTGILPNVGDPSKQTALSPILVSAGNAVLGVAGTTGGATGTLPGGQVTGTVTKVLTDTGQALVKAGNGQAYLVDGLAAAVGDAVTISLANKTLTSPASGTSLLGVSVLSPTQAQGSLATAGALSGSPVVNASVNPIAGVPNNGALQTTAGQVIGTVGTTVNGIGSATPATGGLVGTVTNVAAPVTATAGAALGAGGSITTPLGGASGGAGAGAGASGTLGNTLGGVSGLLGKK